MSEKRFTLDDELRYIMEYGMPMTILEVVDLLNEQQATITEQEEHIKLLTKTIERMIKKINKIYKLSASERSV